MSTGATASSSPGSVTGYARWQDDAAARCRAAVGGDTLAGWPLSAQLPLGALPTAVPCARWYARVLVHEWGLPALADPAELIVSELVTNSIQASADSDGRPRYDGGALPVVHLRLASDGVSVLVEVWDGIPDLPAVRQAGPDEEHGRGLALVGALSDRWDWTTVPGWPGKVVWAELRGDPGG